MDNCTPYKTSTLLSPKLSKKLGTPIEDQTLYRSIIGSLQYITLTRPDISIHVNLLSQFLNNPTDVHLQAAKRILRYLKGTSNFNLRFTPKNVQSNTLVSYCDPNWGTNLDDRISVFRFNIWFGENLVAWSAKKQNVVAKSSCESKYRALSGIVSEVKWFCNLVTELGIRLTTSPLILCENKSTIFLAKNPSSSSRTRHRYFSPLFRNLVNKGAVRIEYVPSKKQYVDEFTKVLGFKSFFLHRTRHNLALLDTNLNQQRKGNSIIP